MFLWDIDIYASKYGLTKKEHEAVLSCSKMMEEYLTILNYGKNWNEILQENKNRWGILSICPP